MARYHRNGWHHIAEISNYSEEMIKDLKDGGFENDTYQWFIGEGLYYENESVFANGGEYHADLLSDQTINDERK